MPFRGAETLPRSIRDSSAIAVSLVVVFAVLVPGSGAGTRSRHADTPPKAGNAAPGLKTNSTPPTCPTRTTDPAIGFDRPFRGGPSPDGDVCGTQRDDSLKVTGKGGDGTQIWAGPGRDVVQAQNHRVDEIWGGIGDNTATIDSCDTPHTVQHLKRAKVKCPGVRQSRRLQSHSEITYPYDEPDVLCTIGTSGSRLVTIPHEPEIRAVDATANVDWETVAFSALLYTSNGTNWMLADQSPWVWSRAPDEQLEDFAGNFWRQFGATGHDQILFHPTNSGRYRVAIRYHWYAANGIAEHDELQWANYHFGHFGSASQGYCDFPGTPPPDGHYVGTTDDGRAVSFDAAPIFAAAPREVAGSRLLNVKFGSTITCTPTRTTTQTIDVASGRWIQLNADYTFAYTRSGGVTSTTRLNQTATYSMVGKIDASGTARGSVYISQDSFDENGTHYTCAGTAHGWTATKSG